MYSFRFVEPASQLRAFVSLYAQRTLRLPRGATIVHPVTARSRSLIEFIFGDRFEIQDRHGSAAKIAASSLVGLQTHRRLTMVLGGTFESFSVHFRPAGLSRLFGLPAATFTDTDHEVSAVLGAPLRKLEEQLANCESFDARARMVDRFLTTYIGAGGHCGIAAAAQLILRAPHLARIADLAARSGLSLRQFERNFTGRIGITPKTFARIARFEAALSTKARAPDRSWTDISHALAYHDQTHMIRDFKEFAGEAPARMLVECAQPIASVQRGWREAVGPLLL